MKILKIVSATLVSLIIVLISYAYVAYKTWTPDDVEGVPDHSAMKYYQASYEDCRASFRKKAMLIKSRCDGVEFYPIQVKSLNDDDLFMDVCYVPARSKKSRLVILSSGIHGIEGFVGSAVQQMVMEELVGPEMDPGTGILFLHGMNPYGFKNSRRVTENNIDLNRNCNLDSTLFILPNKGYSELYDMLNPVDATNTGSLRNMLFMLVALEKLFSKSMNTLRQAILHGQYEHPQGLYFGGKKLEQQIRSIAPILVNYGRDYGKVLEIDLHTGYGAMGVLHVFPNPVSDPIIKSAIRQVFAGSKVDWADTDGFYTISGSFSDFVGKMFPGKLCLPMSFEYGTLNSQTTMGSIRSIHNMILENQGYHYGYTNIKSKAQVHNNFREMYYPSSLKWRSKVINDSRKMIVTTLKNFQELK